MYNFNLDEFESWNLGRFLEESSLLRSFLLVILAVGIIILWVFSSIGIMNLAKKNKISHAWIAFFPIGKSYLVAKLGYEVYDKEKKHLNFVWITLALAASSFVLADSHGELSTLIRYALLFFEAWGFYNIFTAIDAKRKVVYTVFTVLTNTLLGGVFLYSIKENNEIKTEEKEKKKKSYCSNCGNLLSKEQKFCQDCGQKIK